MTSWTPIVWLGWLGLLLVLEALGYWHITPWTTLSEFAWHLEDDAEIWHWKLTRDRLARGR